MLTSINRKHYLWALIVVAPLVMLLTSVSVVRARLPISHLTVIDAIEIGGGSTYMALTPNGRRLYAVQLRGATPDVYGEISVIDTFDNEIIGSIELNTGFPMGIALDTDGKRGYIPVSKRAGDVISTGSDRVDVIDIASNSVIAEIPIAGIDNKGPTDVAVKPDGSRVYVTHRGDNRVIVIDTSSHTVVKSIDLGAGGAEGTSGIAVTPDGSRVYTADRESRTVSVVDTDTNSLVATIPVDIGPSGSKTFIAISPDGNRAYTTFRDADIAVVDTDPTSPTFHSQIGILHSSGESLNGIAMVPTGSLTYIADGVADGKLLILDTNPASPDFHRELGFVTVGDTPVDVVVQNPQIAHH